MSELDFKAIEEKWQAKWDNAKLFEVNEDSNRPPYYVLEMFPYPSGSGLHMGHALNYTIGDILARFKIMQGFNVLHPAGYDALGLPAENAAIKAGTHPEDYTNNSIANFMKQQRKLGITYDWSRILNTASSEYYRWDQWIFLKMFEKGLAYQKESAVNWCPKCNTVLANEQVHEGNCWRHEDTPIEIKHLKQWFLKITDYADELYEGIENLNWPFKTKAMQKNWIGKSHGSEIEFEINGEFWPVFTTRPDTIFGVTFMVVSAQHNKLWDLVTDEQKEVVQDFLKKLGSVSEKELADMEKEGIFTGSYAINPASSEKIPIYAGNFVVADYGSGMVMAVPAHDKRDYEFAKKYGIKIKQVIKRPMDCNKQFLSNDDIYTDKEGTLIDSGEFNEMKTNDAIMKITEWLGSKGKAKRVINFRLRDWGISRQRYWGTPIPIIHCEKCGSVAVPESDLPIILPKDVKFGDGNPLLTNEEWVNTTCPKCGGVAKRETDTMDTFANSSWYNLRFADPNNSEVIFDKEKVKYWNPIDVYIGGAEHACMHLIYFRFYTKFLRDLGLINFGEPAKQLFHQGMLHAEDGQKMSKSKGNVVEPLGVVSNYGVDATRLFLVSVASPDKDFSWSEKGIQGSFRFIKKVYSYFNDIRFGKTSEDVEIKLNQTIKNLTEYLGNFQYRKGTIELRELFDKIEKSKEINKDTLDKFLKLLNPFCPHLTEELWEKLGNERFISNSSWPEYNENKLKVEKKQVEVNEKVIFNVKNIVDKLREKQEVRKVYLYVLPFEIDKLNAKIIGEFVGCEVIIYSVKDSEKYDPENKSKKARPGMPGIFVE